MKVLIERVFEDANGKPRLPTRAEWDNLFGQMQAAQGFSARVTVCIGAPTRSADKACEPMDVPPGQEKLL